MTKIHVDNLFCQLYSHRSFYCRTIHSVIQIVEAALVLQWWCHTDPSIVLGRCQNDAVDLASIASTLHAPHLSV